ncbi:hypothetical protein VTN02DRAFT_4635 [Thermoascus thermophilus]
MYGKHCRTTSSPPPPSSPPSSSSSTSTRKILPAKSTKSNIGRTRPLQRTASAASQPSDRELIDLYERNIYNDYRRVPTKRRDHDPWHPDASAPTVSREDFRRYQRLVEAQMRRLRLERDEYRRMWNREKSRADSGVKRFRETRERIRREVESDYGEFNGALRATRNEPQWPPPGGETTRTTWLYDNFEDRMRQHFVTVTLVAAENALLADRDEEAEKLVLEALDVARGLDYQPLEARCKYWLGRIEYFREREEKALQYFLEARPCVGRYMEGAELQLYLSLFQPGLAKKDRERILLNNDRAIVAAHEKELRDRKKRKDKALRQKENLPGLGLQVKETTTGTNAASITIVSPSAKQTDDAVDNDRCVLPIDTTARGIKRKMDDRPENLTFRRPWIRPRKKAVRDVTKFRPTLWIAADDEPPTKVPRASTTHRSVRGRDRSKCSRKKGKKNSPPPPSSIHALPPQATAQNSTGFNLTGRYSDLSWLFASLSLGPSLHSSSSASYSRGNRPPQSEFTFPQHLLGPS